MPVLPATYHRVAVLHQPWVLWLVDTYSLTLLELAEVLKELAEGTSVLVQEDKKEVAAAEAEGEAEGEKAQAEEDKADEDFKPDQPEEVAAADGATLPCSRL